MNEYLFRCNNIRDVENNIGEVEIPEFTMEYVNNLDTNYKKQFAKIRKENNNNDEISIRELHNNFELNELFIEHMDYITILRDMVIQYVNITEKHKRIRMYFQDILPILQKNKENIEDVIQNLHI
tara:strand:- start:55 stop:429 length:375 start_codon:yes stop_codon:yes gene_type:complete